MGSSRSGAGLMLLWPQFACVWCSHIGPQYKFSSHCVLTQMKQTGPGNRVTEGYQEGTRSWAGLAYRAQDSDSDLASCLPGLWAWSGLFQSIRVPLLDFVLMWWMLSLVHSRRRTLVNTGISRSRPRAVIFLLHPPKSVLLAIASHLEIHLFFRWLLTGIASLWKWALVPLPSGVWPDHQPLTVS